MYSVMPLILVNWTLAAQDRKGTKKRILIQRKCFYICAKFIIKIDVSWSHNMMPNNFPSEEPFVEQPNMPVRR